MANGLIVVPVSEWRTKRAVGTPELGTVAWTGTAHETVVVTVVLNSTPVKLQFPGGRPVRVVDEAYNELSGRELLIRWERTD